MVVPRRTIFLVLAAAFVIVACSGSSAPTIETVGLEVRADVQQGTTFQIVVPQDPEVRLSVAQTPPDVVASFTPSGDDGLLFTIEVGPAAPEGPQKIDLLATVDGEASPLEWDFVVVPAP